MEKFDENPEMPEELPPEKETEHARKSVWIVDDNQEFVGALQRWLSMEGDIGTDARHFQEGEQAISEFGQIAEQKGQMPNVILMDYRLDEKVKDPKFRTGVEVVSELRTVAEKYGIQLPDIVAFSTEQSYADELLKVGARSSLKKSDPRKVVEFIKSV